jgi:hypothetical protein
MSINEKSLDYCENDIQEVFAELLRAEELHPGWPDNLFEQIAIIGEELGELQQAALQAKYEGKPADHIRTEAIQLAAMSLRFLFNL